MITTADAWYNLGNQHYEAGELPQAILCWRRALAWDPGDEDARFNLDLARSQTRDELAPAPSGHLVFWQDLFTPAELGWSGVALLGAAGVLLALRPRWALLPAIPGALAGAGALGALAAMDDHAVVMAPKIQLFSAISSGASLGEVHAGAELEVVDRSGAWLRVALPDGRQGWTPEAGLALTDPRLDPPATPE